MDTPTANKLLEPVYLK